MEALAVIIESAIVLLADSLNAIDKARHGC